MAARSRPGYALRTMLGDEQARGTAAEAVRVLAATSGSAPLVLTVPTPSRWLVAAARQAGADPSPPDAAQAETASIYAADFLRMFAGAGVDGLLLDEDQVPVRELIHPEAYRPVLNVADHYEWPVLMLARAAPAWPHGPVPGVTVWLGSAPPAEPSGRWGILAGTDFWDGADPPADAAPVLASVPEQADPEVVMKRVRALT
jgi:hypothetical protein